ncbi:general transcription factor IIIAa [Polymixia lowei]
MDTKKEPHKRYICSHPGCQACYNKQWKLDAHMCKHTGLKPFACERCGKSFCTKYHLARHELSHGGVKSFRCTVDGCTDAFTTRSNLTRHISRGHNRERKKYACSFDGCDLAFQKNKQLKAHVCERHAQLPPYRCAFRGCEMRFSFPSKLKRHEKVHRGYPCAEEGCAFTGKTWTEYLKHRKDAHRAVVRCDRCDKVFRDAWFLQQHQRVHSEVRVVLKCPRDGCDRSFTTAFNLQSHINSFHEALKPFACPHEGCGKTFAMKQSLRRHSVVHDPERKKINKPRPKRTLASRLSGYKAAKKTQAEQPQDNPDPVSKSCDVPGQRHHAPVELLSILQDTKLLCSTVLETSALASGPTILPAESL